MTEEDWFAWKPETWNPEAESAMAREMETKAMLHEECNQPCCWDIKMGRTPLEFVSVVFLSLRNFTEYWHCWRCGNTRPIQRIVND